jgi:hypothetical protein
MSAQGEEKGLSSSLTVNEMQAMNNAIFELDKHAKRIVWSNGLFPLIDVDF